MLTIFGILGNDQIPLDEQPQSLDEAIAYAKWTCTDWDRVIVCRDKRCIGVAKVCAGMTTGTWFQKEDPEIERTCPAIA